MEKRPQPEESVELHKMWFVVVRPQFINTSSNLNQNTLERQYTAHILHMDTCNSSIHARTCMYMCSYSKTWSSWQMCLEMMRDVLYVVSNEETLDDDESM